MYISALLFGISANIDTLVLGFSYGIKKQHISLKTNLLLSLITLAGTLLSIGLGLHLASFLSLQAAQIAGSLLLIGLGLYYCLKYMHQILCCRKKRDSILAASLALTADTSLSGRETLALGITLTVNNAGMGIGASFAGIHFFLTSTVTFVLCALFLIIGNRLGARFALPFWNQWADLLSGLIIIALGVYELLP